MHVDSPVLLIDGFQRLHASENHIIINDISRLILYFYIHNTNVYHIAIIKENYDSTVYKRTIFDPILTANICDIRDDGNNLFIYQENGNIDCYKLPLNIDSKCIKHLSFRNVKTMQFVDKTYNDYAFRHGPSLLAFVQNDKPNYVGIVQNDDGVYIKFDDVLTINKIYIGNAESSGSKMYIFDQKGKIHEIEINALLSLLNRRSFNNSPSFPRNLQFIKPKFATIAEQINNDTRIIHVVSNASVTFLIDQNGIVYGRRIQSRPDRSDRLYGSARNIEDNIPKRREKPQRSHTFKIHGYDKFALLRIFYKNNDSYIPIKKIVLADAYAIALDKNGYVYVWGDTGGLIKNNNGTAVCRLDVTVNSTSKDKMEIYYYKDMLWSKEMTDNSNWLQFDDITSGCDHSFIISDRFHVCIGWGVYDWIGMKLVDKNVKMVKCMTGEMGLTPTRITLIEKLMKQNREVRVNAFSNQTYIVVTHS